MTERARVDPTWDPDTGLLTYWPAEEGERRRREWVAGHAGAALLEGGAEHGLLVLQQPSFGYGAEVEGAWLRVGAQPLLDDGRGQLGAWLRDELLVPLFACCMPGLPRFDPDDEDYEPPPTVAVARLYRVGNRVEVEPGWQVARPWLEGRRAVTEVDTWLGGSTAAARAAYVEEFVLPAVREEFAADPRLRSVLLMVAQFPDDNAEDEVHLRLVCSELPVPDTTSSDAFWQSAYEGKPADPVNLPSGGVPVTDHLAAPRDYLRPVALFAAYCVEGASQLDYDFEHWRPYALFRTDPSGAVEPEVTGVQVRPWLDGVHLV